MQGAPHAATAAERAVGCDGCLAEADAERRRREAALEAERTADLRDWLYRLRDDDLVAIVKQLSMPKRIYLEGLRLYWAETLDFVGIAQAVGIQVRWVENYLLRYQALGLVFFDSHEWHLHPAIRTGRVRILP